MPNARVGYSRVNARVERTQTNARTRVSTGLLAAGNTHEVGSPIGLLLVLTYPLSFTDPGVYFGEDRPVARIESD